MPRVSGWLSRTFAVLVRKETADPVGPMSPYCPVLEQRRFVAAAMTLNLDSWASHVLSLGGW
jgi:hypothetical protein